MAANSSWRTIELQGSAPWGFRITDSKNQIQPGLKVSKVRTRSSAYSAGLRDNDIILAINDVPTHSMTLQQASDLIDSCQRLRLAVKNSSLNRKNDENQHNFVNEDYNNINNNNNSNNKFGLNNLQNEQTHSYLLNNSYLNNTKSSSLFEDRPVSGNTVESIKKQLNVNRSNETTNIGSKVLVNPAFSKFNSIKQQTQEQTVNTRLFSNNNNNTHSSQFSPQQQHHYQNQSSYQQQFGTLSNYNRQPQQQQQNTHNSTTMRRNYFSATESCGEETDLDDNVFINDNQPKQSYASITLRPPLKDINYFSDTETMQTPRNFYKVRQQFNNYSQPKKPIAQQFHVPRPGNRAHSQSSDAPHNYSSLRNLNDDRQHHHTTTTPVYNAYQPPKQHQPQPQPLHQPQPQHQVQPQQQQQQPHKPLNIPSNATTNTYNNKQSFSLLNRNANSQPRPFINQSTDNPYSPSPSSTATTPSLFKVPNIYEKLQLNQQQQQQQQPSQLFKNYQIPNEPEINKNNDQIDTSINNDASNEQEDLVYDPYKRYELEMGTELMKHSEKPLYGDSYFYNNPSFNYPTIDDQKRLAKVIASTLEGSDPEKSKYHKHKKNQINNQVEPTSGDASSYLPNMANYLSPSPNATSQNTFVFDENLPEVIRKSIKQAEMVDPVRMIHATEEFKQKHFTEHSKHTEMPPQAAMSLAAALHQQGGRGAQIFQKRKARSEKWVVDDSTVKKTPTTPVQMKFTLPQTPEPTPQVPRKPLILAQKFEETQQNKYSNFNTKPKGWNSGDDYTQAASSAKFNAPRLSIDQSIREGIQELHFSNEPLATVEKLPEPQPQTPQQPQDQQNYFNKFSMQPNKLDLSSWNLQKEQNKVNREFAISKDGIQGLKQRLNAEAQEQQNSFSRLNELQNQKPKTHQFAKNYEPIRLNLNENFSPVPTISKVKLNKLNTNDFLSNTTNSNINTNNNQNNNIRSNQKIDSYNTYSFQNKPNFNASNVQTMYDDDEIAASDL